MTRIPATIAAELLEHADGRPVAYIDATAVAVFTYQLPDGAYVIDVYTRDDITHGRLRLLLDGEPVLSTSRGLAGCPPKRSAEPSPYV